MKQVHLIENTMKEIVEVTLNGINYLMDIKKRLGSQYTDEKKEFWENAKYVGIRFALSDPPAIEFYTVPRIHFVFSTRDSLYEVLVAIKKAGWRTNDGE